MQKKKLAIISFFLPYPVSYGGAVAQYFFLEHLQKNYDITFITHCRSLAREKDIKTLMQLFPEVSFEYNKDFAGDGNVSKGTRSYYTSVKVYIYKSLQAIGVIKHARPRFGLSDLPHGFLNFMQSVFNNKQFDFVQAEIFGTLPLVDFFPANALKIFIHHEIRYKILAQSNQHEKEDIRRVQQYELQQLNRFDRVVVFNEEDKIVLEKELSNKTIIVSPFAIPECLVTKKKISGEFSQFIFIGPQDHPANKEGLGWFLDSIYIPNQDKIIVPIKVIGIWKDDFISKYKKYKKIVFVGFVDDIESLYENSVLISPIISGSGLRTKILQAFANSVPVFSTDIGAEGLLNVENNHIVLFNEHNFLDKFLTLFKNEELKRIAVNAKRYYDEHFSTQQLIEKRTKAYL